MLEELNTRYTNIPEVSEEVIAGIDEAGRGPVIGPMVYAVFVMPKSLQTNFKDSKVLSPAVRERLFKEATWHMTVAVSPVYITSHMKAKTKTLNEIARDAVVELLNELQKKCSNVKCVYVDALGNNDEYRSFLSSRFPYKFVVENKADSKYQAVSGASIVAKVTRDRMVGLYDCGSGYPSDPNTLEWLKTHKGDFFGMPSIVRHSWKTIEKYLPAKKARRLPGSLSNFYVAEN